MSIEQLGESRPMDDTCISGLLTRIVSEYEALPGLVLTGVQMQRI
jgi:hypothetical protein